MMDNKDKLPFGCSNCAYMPPSAQEVIDHNGDCVMCGDSILAFTTDTAQFIIQKESELTTLRAELDNIKTSWALLHTENEKLKDQRNRSKDVLHLKKLEGEIEQLRAYKAEVIDEHTNARGEPDAIYLQLHDPDEPDQLSVADYKADVTWCWHKINNNDVRYIREDLAIPSDRVADKRQQKARSRNCARKYQRCSCNRT